MCYLEAFAGVQGVHRPARGYGTRARRAPRRSFDAKRSQKAELPERGAIATGEDSHCAVATSTPHVPLLPHCLAPSHWGGYQMHNLYSRFVRRQKDYLRITNLPHRREKYIFRDPDTAFLTYLGVFLPLIFHSHISGGKTGAANWTHANSPLSLPPPPASPASQPENDAVTPSQDLLLNSQVGVAACLVRGGTWLVTRRHRRHSKSCYWCSFLLGGTSLNRRS